MRTLIILLFLFYINGNSQQKKDIKRYLDTEAINQEYNAIKTKYQSLVEKNKKNLIYNYGVYFKKSNTIEEQHYNEKWIDPLQSESTLFLIEGNRRYFIDDKGQTEDIFTLQNNKLIEKASGIKNSNRIFYINNLLDGISARYDFNDDIVHLAQYIQDEFDPAKRDILLEQKFVHNKLISKKNYQKDFKTSQKEMLKKLPDNFHKTAQKYLEKQCLKKNISSESCKIRSEQISMLKEDLNKAILNKNDFYKEIRIYKIYNEDNYPIYEIYIQLHSEFWEMKIDGKTNIVLSINYELLNA